MATTGIHSSPHGDLPHIDAPSIPHFLLSAWPDFDASARLFYNDSKSHSWSDLANGAYKLAKGWRDTEWIQKDQVVALFLPNQPNVLEVMCGLHLVGAVVSPCNSAVRPHEFAHQLKLSSAKRIITVQKCSQVVSDAIKLAGLSPDAVLFLDDGSIDKIKASILEDYSPTAFLQSFPLKSYSAESTAFICWSSGTSGDPKAVPLSHLNIIANILQNKCLLGDRFNSIGDQWNKEKRSNQVHIDVLPQFHAYGLIMTFLALYTGTPRFVMERFGIDAFLAIVKREKVTFSLLVPPALLALAKSPSVKPEDVKSLRSIASGAAALPLDIRTRFKAQFDIIITDGYGCTECAPVIAAQNPGDVVNGHIGVGLLAPGIKAKLVDPATSALVTSKGEGEICISGPNVFHGYLHNDLANKDAFDSEGYYKTGDVGTIIDGHLRITDRTKDLVKYNGFQISVSELEAILISHPAVADAAVIGVMDKEKATELPRAFVVPADNIKPTDELANELIEHVNSQVAGYKKLRGGVRWIDAVPKNASGKILRKDLKARRD